jgi:hypothetical protein
MKTILVGAKYVGSICTGLASALPVVSGVLMSIPRNLVCWGEMDPGSTPPSVVTSVAGAPWEPAWFHELESDVEWGEFMIDSSFLHASDGCSLFLVIHSTDGFTLLCLWDSLCLYQSMTQLPKMQGTTLCCDLSQINMQTKWHGNITCQITYRCWTHLQAPPLDSHLEYKLATWSLLSK